MGHAPECVVSGANLSICTTVLSERGGEGGREVCLSLPVVLRWSLCVSNAGGLSKGRWKEDNRKAVDARVCVSG